MGVAFDSLINLREHDRLVHANRREMIEKLYSSILYIVVTAASCSLRKRRVGVIVKSYHHSDRLYDLIPKCVIQHCHPRQGLSKPNAKSQPANASLEVQCFKERKNNRSHQFHEQLSNMSSDKSCLSERCPGGHLGRVSAGRPFDGLQRKHDKDKRRRKDPDHVALEQKLAHCTHVNIV